MFAGQFDLEIAPDRPSSVVVHLHRQLIVPAEHKVRPRGCRRGKNGEPHIARCPSVAAGTCNDVTYLSHPCQIWRLPPFLFLSIAHIMAQGNFPGTKEDA